MHDLDTVVVPGWGTCTRQQARTEALTRLAQTGDLMALNKLPADWVTKANAFLMAASGPAYKVHEPKSAPAWPSYVED